MASRIAPLLRKLETTGPIVDARLRAAIEALPTHLKGFAAGNVVVREGSRPQSSIIVLSGCLFRHKIVGDGKRQIISFHFGGDMPDLHSLFLETMDHNLSSLGPCELAFVPHEALRELVVTHADAGQRLWRETLLDAAIFREWIVTTGRRRAVSRTAHLLCELMVRSTAAGVPADTWISYLTQNHLADALGLSLVHVNRSLQELRRGKLVEIGQGQFRILDWPKLREVADFDEGYLHLKRPAGT